MWSVAITVELKFKSVLESASVLAILVVAFILLITWRYRKFFQLLKDGRFTNLELVYDKRPVPEENEESYWNTVSEKALKKRE